MSAQASLFAPPAASAGPAEAPVVPVRFGRGPHWRAPTFGEPVCSAPGCGSSAPFGLGDAWFCRDDLPPHYLPARNGGAR